MRTAIPVLALIALAACQAQPDGGGDQVTVTDDGSQKALALPDVEDDAGTAFEAGSAENPTVGHDGSNLAGTFITTDMHGVVTYWTVDFNEHMTWEDSTGKSGTATHLQNEDGLNCIDYHGDDIGPYCFVESAPTEDGKWLSIRNRDNEGVIVERITAHEPPAGAGE